MPPSSSGSIPPAGLDFQEKTSGQLAPKFSDLVANKSYNFSEKHGKLVACEKKLVTMETPAVATLSSDWWVYYEALNTSIPCPTVFPHHYEKSIVI